MRRPLWCVVAASSIISALVAGCSPLGDDGRGGEVLFVRGTYPREAIYRMSADGGDVARVVAGSLPRWSPDATRFAYVTDKPDRTGYTVWVMNPDTGSRRRIVTADAVTALAWAPDGKTLAYSNSSDIFVVDSETGDQQLVSIGILVDGLDWSPDGREILVGPGVVVLDVGTGAERTGAPGRSVDDGR